jgi:hypothetical protein
MNRLTDWFESEVQALLRELPPARYTATAVDGYSLLLVKLGADAGTVEGAIFCGVGEITTPCKFWMFRKSATNRGKGIRGGGRCRVRAVV